MEENDVQSAIDIVLEELENVIDHLKSEGVQAFENGDYNKVKKLGEKGEQVNSFYQKVNNLRKEWLNIAVSVKRPKAKKIRRKKHRKLQHGLRTPESAFRIPILKILVELDGKGTTKEILAKVERSMKYVLNDYDYMPLSANPHTPRWRNTAQWSRVIMVKDGLLRNDSPRGVWEITDKGRKYLEETIGRIQ